MKPACNIPSPLRITKYLIGLSRYYNGDLASYTEDHLQFLREYFLAQLDSFENGESGVGWFMWTMKVEFSAGPEWDFLYLWENGIIPADLCSRDHYCNQI